MNGRASWWNNELSALIQTHELTASSSASNASALCRAAISCHQTPIKHHFPQHKQGRIESSISHIFFSNNHDSTWLAAWLRFWVVIRFGVTYEWVLSRCYAHVKQVSRSNARHTWLDFRAAAAACASAADFSSVACCRPAESIEQTE